MNALKLIKDNLFSDSTTIIKERDIFFNLQLAHADFYYFLAEKCGEE